MNSFFLPIKWNETLFNAIVSASITAVFSLMVNSSLISGVSTNSNILEKITLASFIGIIIVAIPDTLEKIVVNIPITAINAPIVILSVKTKYEHSAIKPTFTIELNIPASIPILILVLPRVRAFSCLRELSKQFFSRKNGNRK